MVFIEIHHFGLWVRNGAWTDKKIFTVNFQNVHFTRLKSTDYSLQSNRRCSPFVDSRLYTAHVVKLRD